MLRLIALLAVLSVLPAGSSQAVAETRAALVVGNSAYRNTATLANPLNDARDVAAALKSVGFDVVEALDADKAKFDSALRTFAGKLATADVALFFYAGHGLQLGAQNYLVPIDATLERERDLEFEAVKLDFVLRQMEIDREGKTTIVFLDACRDNPLSRNLARSMGTRSAALGRGLAPASTGLGTFIAFSTQPGNVALDGDGRNSPFTAALLKNIAVRGYNLPATMIEVRKSVVAATNGSQVPWDHSALTGDFYFVPGEAAVAQGSVQAPPAGTPTDVAALQERLRKLELEAQERRTAGPAAGAAGLTADQMKLVELRTRAANLKELTSDLQRKVLNTRMQEGKATDAAEKERLKRMAIDIQMEMTRRILDLKKLNEEIAALEGSSAPATVAVAASNAPPVIPVDRITKESPNFDLSDNVSLAGTQMRAFRAPSPAHCRDACERETTCVGFQHGKKVGVMGQCALFSKVDTRHEDRSWRSGMRRTAPAAKD